MKHLKRYDEGIFDFFRSNSEDDKIALDFMKRLKRISGISPYKIEFDNEGTEDGESYFKRYKIIFDDVPIKISQAVCDKRYIKGWGEETQKSWIKTGVIKKNNHIFYSLYTIQQKEYILAKVNIVEDLFELIEKIYNEDKKHRRIKKIKDEMNPAADLLDPEIYDDHVEESVNLREVKFTNKRNPRLEIVVTKSPDGRIIGIENETGIRFPFSLGQLLQRNVEVWACNNNFLIDGKDTCPDKKIFGVKTKDVPKGHEWRHIFPNKF